jgi:uncharacterized protein YkwD
MPGRHSQRRPRRRSWGRVSWALPLAAALVAGGFVLSRNSGGPPQPTAAPSAQPGPCTPAQDAVTIAAECTRNSGHGTPNGTGVPRSNGASRTQQGTGPDGPHRTGSPHPGRSPGPSSPPASPPAAGPPGGSPPPGSLQQSPAATQVLVLINEARAQAGLPPYEVDPALISSALGHDVKMMDGCGLSHQCLHEPDLGARETNAGVQWTSAGENVGEGGQAASSSQITAIALNLTHEMLAENPPDDGHRRNLLSSDYTYAGIAVIVDDTGTVWMTQDFSN